MRVVTNPTKAARLRDRAARLRQEARNCLTIAVGEKVEQHAAQLIDEAIRLMRRSAELSAPEAPTG
ncbi:MAG: hypothetical protein JWM65_491 [Sphingomonas bacterium]|nr:hypothetical protein [Sphingomonas bacterium]